MEKESRWPRAAGFSMDGREPEACPMLARLAPIAADIGAALKARGQTIAVADGATGGLISAGLLTMAGATGFYRGGGVVYSLAGRDVLLSVDRAALKGMSSVTEDYALLQARAIRDRFGADWGIAESGSAGPSHPAGVTAGRSVIAIAGPKVDIIRRVDTGSDDRIANMEAFALAALAFLRDTLV